MWVFYTALSLFILLTAYFFILPLAKKRPVLIRSGGIAVYSTVLAITLYPLLEIWLFVVIATAIALFLSSRSPWLVYGVTATMIFDALEKAAFATRAPIEKLVRGYRIDSSLKVRLCNIVRKIHIISFNKGGESKRAELTTVVFKKFIQNYYV